MLGGFALAVIALGIGGSPKSPSLVLDFHDGEPKRITQERERQAKQRSIVESAVSGPKVAAVSLPNLPKVFVPAIVSGDQESEPSIDDDDDEEDVIFRMVFDAEKRRVKDAVSELLKLL
jgi:hypothetical protein